MDYLRYLAEFRQIAQSNRWTPLHTPRNLACAISVEAAELLEQFQWLSDEASDAIAVASEHHNAIASEVADILLYTFALCERMGIDPERALNTKIDANRGRFLKDDNDRLQL